MSTRRVSCYDLEPDPALHCLTCHEDEEYDAALYPLFEVTPSPRHNGHESSIVLFTCCAVDTPESRDEWAQAIRAWRTRTRKRQGHDAE